MIHSGSRGLGHQVCQDHLKVMVGAARKYGFDLPDRQLCCAPIESPEGRSYLGAMAAAANFAFANRQVMAHWVRKSIAVGLGIPTDAAAVHTVFDVCHNIAKFETFDVGGRRRRLCVHRKGVTRAYPPGHPQVSQAYRAIGWPVLVPGDMGRYSYVLAGTALAAQETFGSSCHGAGRRMSRSQARRAVDSCWRNYANVASMSERPDWPRLPKRCQTRTRTSATLRTSCTRPALAPGSLSSARSR